MVLLENLFAMFASSTLRFDNVRGRCSRTRETI